MQIKFELDFKIDLISALILKLNWFQVWFQNWIQSCFQNQIDLRNQINLVIMISKIVQTALHNRVQIISRRRNVWRDFKVFVNQIV
jgi:hypothetical protein